VLTRAVTALVLALGSLAIAGPSLAGGCPTGNSPVAVPGGGVICITASDPGGDGESGATPTGTNSSPGCTRSDGTPVPCASEYWGTWFASQQCHAFEVFVPASDPVWAGHSDGAVWMCTPTDDGLTPDTLFWVPPGAAAAPLPDPGALAQRALGQLVLETAEVQTAPKAPDASIVGVEVWTWVPSPQWRALSKTVTAGATSVTVRAAPSVVTWDMGPASHACAGPGRAWTRTLGGSARTTCGFTYAQTSKDQPGGSFPVSAQITYDVDWTCAGACLAAAGTLGQVQAPPGTGSIRVDQRQTVVTQ
jgi:hypothetical protein